MVKIFLMKQRARNLTQLEALEDRMSEHEAESSSGEDEDDELRARMTADMEGRTDEEDNEEEEEDDGLDDM